MERLLDATNRPNRRRGPAAPCRQPKYSLVANSVKSEVLVEATIEVVR